MTLTPEAVHSLRQQFPALQKTIDGQPAIFFDGPAGTQVPQSVIDAIVHYLSNHNANHGGVFATSIESDQVLDAAHQAAADFLGARHPESIAFGANMTTLTFALSRALARTWSPGDEIILTRLEHDANFSPWIQAAEDADVNVQFVDIDPSDCTLKLDDYARLLNEKTKLVAVSCASNAVGTVNPVQQICTWAKSAGAMTFLDAVHFAPHDLIDVDAWDCDFLICSAYKFFGPHIGIMYGRQGLLESIQPYKLRPSPESLPGRWMTGTQNHACIAGTMAAIDYLADLGRQVDNLPTENRRTAIKRAFRAIREYESALLSHLMGGLLSNPQIEVFGITNEDEFDQRLPTVSIRHQALGPLQLAEALAAEAIFVWHGNYYALPITERLGLEPDGAVRIGLAHYNTLDEVNRLLQVLANL